MVHGERIYGKNLDHFAGVDFDDYEEYTQMMILTPSKSSRSDMPFSHHDVDVDQLSRRLVIWMWKHIKHIRI